MDYKYTSRSEEDTMELAEKVRDKLMEINKNIPIIPIFILGYLSLI